MVGHGLCTLQLCTLPVRMVLFASIRMAIARAGSIESCVSSIVASPAWRASTGVGQALYCWLILGAVWWLQIENQQECPGLTILVSGTLFLSTLRAVLVVVAYHVLMPAAPRQQDSSSGSEFPGLASASPAQIDELPLVQFSCESCKDGFCTGCSICLMDFEDDDWVRRLPCGHDFHQGCIDIWLKRNKRCPLCMRAVDDHVGPQKKCT